MYDQIKPIQNNTYQFWDSNKLLCENSYSVGGSCVDSYDFNASLTVEDYLPLTSYADSEWRYRVRPLDPISGSSRNGASSAPMPPVDWYMNGTAQWYLLCNSWMTVYDDEYPQATWASLSNSSGSGNSSTSGKPKAAHRLTRRVGEYIIMDDLHNNATIEPWSTDRYQMDRWTQQLGGVAPSGWFGSHTAFNSTEHNKANCARWVNHSTMYRNHSVNAYDPLCGQSCPVQPQYSIEDADFNQRTNTSYRGCWFQPEQRTRWNPQSLGLHFEVTPADPNQRLAFPQSGGLTPEDGYAKHRLAAGNRSMPHDSPVLRNTMSSSYHPTSYYFGASKQKILSALQRASVYGSSMSASSPNFLSIASGFEFNLSIVPHYYHGVPFFSTPWDDPAYFYNDSSTRGFRRAPLCTGSRYYTYGVDDRTGAEGGCPMWALSQPAVNTWLGYEGIQLDGLVDRSADVNGTGKSVLRGITPLPRSFGSHPYVPYTLFKSVWNHDWPAPGNGEFGWVWWWTPDFQYTDWHPYLFPDSYGHAAHITPPEGVPVAYMHRTKSFELFREWDRWNYVDQQANPLDGTWTPFMRRMPEYYGLWSFAIGEIPAYQRVRGSGHVEGMKPSPTKSLLEGVDVYWGCPIGCGVIARNCSGSNRSSTAGAPSYAAPAAPINVTVLNKPGANQPTATNIAVRCLINISAYGNSSGGIDDLAVVGAHMWLSNTGPGFNSSTAWMGDVWSFPPPVTLPGKFSASSSAAPSTSSSSPFDVVPPPYSPSYHYDPSTKIATHHGMITLADLRNYEGGYDWLMNGTAQWVVFCSAVVIRANGSIHVSPAVAIDGIHLDPEWTDRAALVAADSFVNYNVNATNVPGVEVGVIPATVTGFLGKRYTFTFAEHNADEHCAVTMRPGCSRLLGFKPYYIDPPTNVTAAVTQPSANGYNGSALCPSNITLTFSMPLYWQNVYISEFVVESMSAPAGHVRPFIFYLPSLPTVYRAESHTFSINDTISTCGIPRTYRVYLVGYWPQGGSRWNSTKHSDVVYIRMPASLFPGSAVVAANSAPVINGNVLASMFTGPTSSSASRIGAASAINGRRLPSLVQQQQQQIVGAPFVFMRTNSTTLQSLVTDDWTPVQDLQLAMSTTSVPAHASPSDLALMASYWSASTVVRNSTTPTPFNLSSSPVPAWSNLALWVVPTSTAEVLSTIVTVTDAVTFTVPGRPSSDMSVNRRSLSTTVTITSTAAATSNPCASSSPLSSSSSSSLDLLSVLALHIPAPYTASSSSLHQWSSYTCEAVPQCPVGFNFNPQVPLSLNGSAAANSSAIEELMNVADVVDRVRLFVDSYGGSFFTVFHPPTSSFVPACTPCPPSSGAPPACPSGWKRSTTAVLATCDQTVHMQSRSPPPACERCTCPHGTYPIGGCNGTVVDDYVCAACPYLGDGLLGLDPATAAGNISGYCLAPPGAPSNSYIHTLSMSRTFYNISDNHTCASGGTAWCVRGACACTPGYRGLECKTCGHGYWGPDCSLECPCGNADSNSTGTGACDRVTGACECTSGRGGADCDECKEGRYGPTCAGHCDCSGHGACYDGFDGDGTCVCDAGWRGAACDVAVEVPALNETLTSLLAFSSTPSISPASSIVIDVFEGALVDSVTPAPLGFVSVSTSLPGVVNDLPMPAASSISVRVAGGSDPLPSGLTLNLSSTIASASGINYPGLQIRGAALRASIVPGTKIIDYTSITYLEVSTNATTRAGTGSTNSSSVLSVLPIRVHYVNHAPFFTPAAVASFGSAPVIVGLGMSLDVQLANGVYFEDADASTIGDALVLVQDPTMISDTLWWVTVTPVYNASGLVSISVRGTPPASVAGTGGNITLQLVDAGGLSANLTVAISVGSQPAALVYRGFVPPAAITGQHYSFQIPESAFNVTSINSSATAIVSVEAVISSFECGWLMAVNSQAPGGGVPLWPTLLGTPSRSAANTTCTITVTAANAAGYRVAGTATINVAAAPLSDRSMLVLPFGTLPAISAALPPTPHRDGTTISASSTAFNATAAFGASSGSGNEVKPYNFSSAVLVGTDATPARAIRSSVTCSGNAPDQLCSIIVSLPSNITAGTYVIVVNATDDAGDLRSTAATTLVVEALQPCEAACSGHGTCSGQQRQTCACSAAYTGEYCDACAEGYTVIPTNTSNPRSSQSGGGSNFTCVEIQNGTSLVIPVTQTEGLASSSTAAGAIKLQTTGATAGIIIGVCAVSAIIGVAVQSFLIKRASQTAAAKAVSSAAAGNSNEHVAGFNAATHHLHAHSGNPTVAAAAAGGAPQPLHGEAAANPFAGNVYAGWTSDYGSTRMLGQPVPHHHAAAGSSSEASNNPVFHR